MRLDKFLKVSRIIKRRTLSKEISQSERVKVNGKVAKPSTKLNVGDLIEIEFGRTILTVKVKLLKEHVLKDESTMLYEIVDEKRKEKLMKEKKSRNLPNLNRETMWYMRITDLEFIRGLRKSK